MPLCLDGGSASRHLQLMRRINSKKLNKKGRGMLDPTALAIINKKTVGPSGGAHGLMISMSN